MAINQWFICCIPFLLWYVCTCFRRLLLEEEEISNVGTRTYILEKKWYTTNKPQIYCHFSVRKMMKNHAIFPYTNLWSSWYVDDEGVSCWMLSWCCYHLHGVLWYSLFSFAEILAHEKSLSGCLFIKEAMVWHICWCQQHTIGSHNKSKQKTYSLL